MITEPADGENRNDDEDQSARQLPEVTETLSQQADLSRLRASKPESVGPYRILDVLGEGGMGVVYLAEQTRPIRRRVALRRRRMPPFACPDRDPASRLSGPSSAAPSVPHSRTGLLRPADLKRRHRRCIRSVA